MRKKFLSFVLIIFLAVFGVSLAGCSSNPNQFEITAQTMHSQGYVVGGNEKYIEGETVTLKAVELNNNEDNSTFLCWVLNNKVVSTDKEYTFEVSKQTAGNYIAVFETPFIEYFNLSSIDFNICEPEVVIGNDDESNAISLINFKIYAGDVEGNLTVIYEYSSDLENTQIASDGQKNINLYNDEEKREIYPNITDTFVFDMQENIYLNIELTYSQFGQNYISSTRAQITGEDDVTRETLTIDSKLLSGDVLVLNDAVGVNDSNMKLVTSKQADISLQFSRINIEKQTTEE